MRPMSARDDAGSGYAARVVFGGSERREAIRLELHQHQPPTATTGTTYNIEMYQCIRQASIAAEPITSSPHLPRRLRRLAGTLRSTRLAGRTSARGGS